MEWVTHSGSHHSILGCIIPLWVASFHSGSHHSIMGRIIPLWVASFHYGSHHSIMGRIIPLWVASFPLLTIMGRIIPFHYGSHHSIMGRIIPAADLRKLHPATVTVAFILARQRASFKGKLIHTGQLLPNPFLSLLDKSLFQRQSN
eukprot:361892-Chlamydomonas_euryale.AAC.1